MVVLAPLAIIAGDWATGTADCEPCSPAYLRTLAILSHHLFPVEQGAENPFENRIHRRTRHRMRSDVVRPPITTRARALQLAAFANSKRIARDQAPWRSKSSESAAAWCGSELDRSRTGRPSRRRRMLCSPQQVRAHHDAGHIMMPI